MADNIPKLGVSSVTPTRPVDQRIDLSVTPAAFGAGIAAAGQAGATDLGQMAARARVMDAQFAAYTAEAQFGDVIDQRVAAFKTDLKALQSTPDVNYPQLVAQLRDKHFADLDADRTKVVAGLRDPLAEKMFNGRMRLQVQTAHKTMLTTGDAQIAEWDKTATTSRLEGYARRAGNVTGDPTVDAANLSLQAGLAAKDIEDYNQRNAIPNDKHDRVISKMEVGMVKEVLGAYGSNYNAGLAFLLTKVPGTEITIGYNPTKPEVQSILSGAETAEWIKHFTGHKQEKVGADLGEILYQESREAPGFDLEARLTELYKSGQYAPEEIAKARQQFTSAVSEGDRRRDIAVGNTYEMAYKLVTSRYGGDIESAIRSRDEDFLRMWSALGSKQATLRAALAREDRLDPAAYGPLGEVIDLGSTPGALARKFPTAAAFAAAYQGTTKHLWPEALKIYERDVNRDTSQDVHYQNYKVDTEIRIRQLTGWKSGMGSGRGAWDEAPVETQAIRSWVVGMAEQAWAEHSQAKKANPGAARISDTLWYRETLSEILSEAGRLKKMGAFKKGLVPDPMSTPGSAVQIRTAAKPQRVIDGVPHEWDGSKWNPIGKGTP